MSLSESELLFLATVKAFKDKITEIIGDIDMTNTNGYKLWITLDKHFMQGDRTSVELYSLCKEYDNMVMINI